MAENNTSLMVAPEGDEPRREASLETQSAASAAGARAEVEAAYTIALARPRNMDTVRLKLLDACKRTKFAKRALYSKPVGGRDIEGLSIRAAEEVIRHMGNFRISNAVTFENDEERKVRVTVTDLEVNSSYTQEITVRKTVERSSSKGRDVVSTRTNTKDEPVFIVKATDDEVMTKESAMVSKVLRNAALRLTPSDILEEIIDQVKATLREKDVQDPKAQMKALLDAFHENGVSPEDIEGHLGHTIDKITPAELQTLRQMYTAIADGQTTWAAYTSGGNGKGKAEKPEV